MRYIAAIIIGCFSLQVSAQEYFKTLELLKCIEGEYILSGQHNDQKDLHPTFEGGGSTDEVFWTERVHSTVGRYPALYGADFLFHGSDQLRWDITYEAERQWNAGAVINLMWHSCPPTEGSSCNWNPGIISELTANEWDDLLTDGGTLNQIWKSRVDGIAVYLQYLEDRGVEVMWRPYHEQNQTVFWWNSTEGPANTIALWRMLHDYMTNDLGLSNLIWVWDVQDIGSNANFANFNPGYDYWDIMALDVYDDAYYNTTYYQTMVEIAEAGDKLIALGECFTLPSAQVLAQYPKFTFFMNWAYGLKYDLNEPPNPTNSDQYIQQIYDLPNVLTLDQMPGWNTMGQESTPFHGNPVEIPGLIQAEDFDLGGNKIAYFDATPGNEYGAYRTEWVDIGNGQDVDQTFSVGQLDEGEWLNYTLEAVADGWFDIVVRAASAQDGAQFHVELDQEAVTPVTTIPNSGDWQNWIDVEVGPIFIPEGVHILTLKIDQSYFNLNYLEVTESLSTLILDQPIATTSESSTFLVFNTMGQLVMQSKARVNEDMISNLPKGVYQVVSGSEVYQLWGGR